MPPAYLSILPVEPERLAQIKSWATLMSREITPPLGCPVMRFVRVTAQGHMQLQTGLVSALFADPGLAGPAFSVNHNPFSAGEGWFVNLDQWYGQLVVVHLCITGMPFDQLGEAVCNELCIELEDLWDYLRTECLGDEDMDDKIRLAELLDIVMNGMIQETA